MPIEKEEWLTLSQAAGCSESIPVRSACGRTKDKSLSIARRGNHRRYIRSEIELWAQTAHRAGGVEPDNIVQFALRRIRFKIGKGQLEAEVWYQDLQ